MINNYKGTLDEYIEKNDISLSNSETAPEKGKLSPDKHLEEFADNSINEKVNIQEISDYWTPERRYQMTFPWHPWHGAKGNPLEKYFYEEKLHITNTPPPTVTNMSAIKIAIYATQNEDLILDLSPRKENDYLLQTYDKIGLLPIKNISLVVAPPKCGKTTFVSIIIASVLGCGHKFGRYEQKKGCKVLHIDTEQGEPDQQKNMQYIFDMCKEEKMTEKEFSQRYRSLHARQIRGIELIEKVEVEIIKYTPDLVVIDGVAQMADDIMSQPEAAKINDQLQLLAEAYKCNIMCVIHTPKMKRNETDTDLYLPKGALGSMLYQGAYDIFTCVKNGEGKPESDQYFIVIHIGRGKETPKLFFVRDPEKDGRPKPYYEIKAGDDKERVCNAIKTILTDNGNIGLSKSDLINKLEKKLGKGFSRATLENKWEKLIAPIKNELCITPKGRATIIKLKDPNDPEQIEFNVIAEPDQPTEEAPF